MPNLVSIYSSGSDSDEGMQALEQGLCNLTIEWTAKTYILAEKYDKYNRVNSDANKRCSYLVKYPSQSDAK
jgi:hypothetical protein